MNRILQADVILTLTADQARDVLRALDYLRGHEPDELFAVCAQRCAKQGVHL